MTRPDTWDRVERLFHDAVSCSEAERATLVRQACGDDETLRHEIESLLAYAPRADDFLVEPAVAVAAALGRSHTGVVMGGRLGPYVVESWLGAGGMGDVYRGRDSRLDRPVAIKILPPLFALDADRRARFEREARLLAALHHPNIAAIFGLEERDGVHALILELVDGETLADRMRAGPLPVRDALAIARQIADALGAAHARRIVHRDLKPTNIVIQHSGGPGDGVVKVLDFGLAKSLTEVPSSAATSSGVVLGTGSYMSPEQARGLVVDSRTDVWSFGCVLYEMLAGTKAFSGATASDTLAAILEHELDWQRLPVATPERIVRLLRRCLQKDAHLRLQDIVEARIEIDRTFADFTSADGNARFEARRVRRRRLIAASVAAIALVTAGAFVAQWVRGANGDGRPTRLSVSVPGLISPQLSAVVSPNGQQLAFVSTGQSGKLMLWVRPLDSLDARVLAGTEDAAHPFWSPDGSAIGFLADGKLKRVAVVGGPVRVLADSPERSGGAWTRDGTILFASAPGTIGIVSADGGTVRTILTRDSEGREPRWPNLLPDGRHFIFFRSSSRPEERGVYLGSIDSSEVRQLLPSEFKGAYASGHLLYVRDDDTLMAQPFDDTRLALTGKPTRVADGIWTARGAGQASFSVSSDGVLAYVNATVAYQQVASYDRGGRLRGVTAAAGRYSGAPQLSPDGTRLAVVQGPVGNEHVWLRTLGDGSLSRFTFGPSRELSTVWAPDGRQLAFIVAAESGNRLVTKSVTDGNEDIVPGSVPAVTVEDWSPDGRYLLYTARGPRSYSDLWLLPLDRSRPPFPYLQTPFNKTQAQVSPDGRWIAYTSYESGADEIYVDSFPVPGRRRQVSTAGGVQPRWRKDGAELFYVAPDQRLMALPVKTESDFDIGVPQALFKTRVLPHGSQSIGLYTKYAVSPDGQSFFCLVPPEDSGPQITVVLNWTAALRDSQLNPR